MATSVVTDHKLESVAGQILVVDDDAELCRLVSRFLGAEGYCVQTVQTSGLGIERALSGNYDLVVLDVMLPEMDGFEVLRRIRTKSSTPILMLTARGDDLDRILGLEMGADDYLPKPFDFAELVARIRALGRRAAAPLPASLEYGDLSLDPPRRVAVRGGRRLPLTPKELAVLECLLAADGRPVSAEELLERVWDEAADPFTTTVKTTIGRLRVKLGDPPVIETVRDSGYRIGGS